MILPYGFASENGNGVAFVFDKSIPDEVASNSQLMLEAYLSRYPTPLSEVHIKSLEKTIPQTMLQSAEPYGYFHAKCRSKITYDTKWIVYITCDMPKITTVSSLDINITGPGKATITDELRQSPLDFKVGQPFSIPVYEKTKQALLLLAYKNGYMDASVDASQIVIHADKNSALVTLNLETGTVYSFGPISFSDHAYDDNFLRNMAPFQPHHRFEQAQLFQYQRSLSQSNLFESVSIKPRFTNDSSSRHVPIYVEYTPIHKLQKRASVSYNSDTQVNMMLGLRRNRIGRYGQYSTHEVNKENIFGSNGRLGISNTLVIPNTHPTSDYYKASIDYTQQYINYATERTSEEKSVNLILSHTKAFSYDDDQYVFLVNYGLNTSNKWSTSINNGVREQTNYNLWVYPELSARLTYLDNTHEYRYTMLLNTSFDFRFYKSTLAQFLFIPLSESSRLLLRNKMGYIASSNYQDLPKSWSFLTGGNTTVRGFNYESIGGSNDNSSFNKLLFEGSIEPQLRLYQNFFLIAYYDVGKASSDELFKDYYHSVGSGVSWESPFGVIEFSVAKRLNELPSQQRSKIAPCPTCKYILAFKNKLI